MKHWQEIGLVLERLLRPDHDGRAAALAVVVGIAGSAYRRPGARLLVEADGGVLGGVSGGCLEEDVRVVGLEVAASGRSRLLGYDTGDDETKLWGLGLGCDGRVEILVQPVTRAAALGPWTAVARRLRGDAPFALAMLAADGAPGGILLVDPDGPGEGTLGDPDLDVQVSAAARSALAEGSSRRVAVAGRQVFLETLFPPPRLLVCGAGDDARPLVALAASVGFRVAVADHRPAYLTPQRFPDAVALHLLRPEAEEAGEVASAAAYAVTMTHSLAKDAGWVGRLLRAGVGYVGLLGPRARSGRIFADLGLGDADVASERLFGPVGLDLGADGPEQVAVAVVAELLAVRAGRVPRHLREREVPVHA